MAPEKRRIVDQICGRIDLSSLDEWYAALTDIINNGSSPVKFERLANAESGILALCLDMKRGGKVK